MGLCYFELRAPLTIPVTRFVTPSFSYLDLLPVANLLNARHLPIGVRGAGGPGTGAGRVAGRVAGWVARGKGFARRDPGPGQSGLSASNARCLYRGFAEELPLDKDTSHRSR